MGKKKYLVSLAKPDKRVKGMMIGGRYHKFSKSGHSFIMSDAGAAKEMNTEYGRARTGDIIISEIPGYRGKEDLGHKYNFTVKKEREDPKERKERMKRDGWVEVKPGKWKRVGTT